MGGLAISSLPPLNGFVSEFVIYSGLFSGAAPSPWGNVAFVSAAALLAFVGGVSALAMTRAFGVAFLGHPRDLSLPIAEDPPPTMLGSMALHAVGAAAVGLAPELGIGLIRGAVGLFPLAGDIDTTLRPLASIVWAGRALAIVLLVVGLVRGLRGRAVRRSPTWGCGYTAATARMQYTGSSFTEPFARIFESFLPALRREQIPSDLFPQRPGHISTHHPDTVERRMFEVLGQGEDLVAQTSSRIPEQPRFAFAAGLITLFLIGAIVFGWGSVP